MQVTICVLVQATLQLTALPVMMSVVQGLPSAQVVGQVAGGSQVSPKSRWPFPQVTGQSLSVSTVQPAGQQPSLWMQERIGVFWHETLQKSGLPLMKSAVQPFPSSQSWGQVAGGSQVSPGPMKPLPQATPISTMPSMCSVRSVQIDCMGSTALNQIMTSA